MEDERRVAWSYPPLLLLTPRWPTRLELLAQHFGAAAAGPAVEQRGVDAAEVDGELRVAVVRVLQVPGRQLRPWPHCVLAEGELTGHSHRIDTPSVAALYEYQGTLFLSVTADSATVVTRSTGQSRCWRQGRCRT